jgi:hypothetical protein
MFVAGLLGRACNPADSAVRPLASFLATDFVKRPWAKGLRQILPVHTKRIFSTGLSKFIYLVPERKVIFRKNPNI